jgi:hypothetical protein
MHSYFPSVLPATFRRAVGTGRSASLVTGTGSRCVSGLASPAEVHGQFALHGVDSLIWSETLPRCAIDEFRLRGA